MLAGLRSITAIVGVLCAATAALGQSDPVQHFEESVRPVLVAKCQGCHNEEIKTSNLSLATREAVLEGGMRGPAVVPGDPDGSALLLAVQREGPLQMPPGEPLGTAEVNALRRWIQEGAAWGSAPTSPAPGTEIWAFRPVERVEPPAVSDPDWVRNPIDAFVLAKLDEAATTPSPEADRRTLIRRATLDVIGLLPQPKDVQAFLDDKSPGAYERVVDRLLQSEHYGERWGRHWLDIARYADTNGYSIDGPRLIWRYRDWVIKALNDNMPFDQFAIEQIAGDLLPNPSQEQLIATGFHRNTMVNQEGGIDFEQYRVEAVVDRVSTTGAAFLGLTLGCARCHDHKFDPISQREFYEIFAFFNNVDELGGNLSESVGRSRMMEPILELADAATIAQRDALKQDIDRVEKEKVALRKQLESEWSERFPAGSAEPIERAREIIVIPQDERSSVQNSVLLRVMDAYVPEFKAKSEELKELSKKVPEIEWTMVMRDLVEPRESYIHVQGDFTRKGDPVEPGTLRALPALPADAPRNRLGLAEWLVSDDNPLTPRVTMNRVWQRYFGLGIVETENDFGSQGEEPTNPDLLDWLASELVRRDWDMKAMHRLILLSSTYRQASQYRKDLAKIDPSNRMLGRQNRLRLEAEIIRDASLSASGLLAPAIGGPSVYPPKPAGTGDFTQVDREWKTDEGPNRYRRGLYTYFVRSAAHPGLILFDAPIAQETVTRRNRSNTPLQALTLLNDETQTEFAAALAKRISSHADTRDERIRYAFELCLSRPPAPSEKERMEQFLAGMTDAFATDTSAVEESGAASSQDAAWMAAARVMINLDEFVTRQ